MTFLPMTTIETAMSNNQLALSRVIRGQQSSLSRATRQTVPPFLQKLYEMVNDPTTDDLIRWSDAGDTFLVLDHERVAHDVLPRWFKHSNFASFVRQLNMYGFHKIPQLQQGVLKSDSNTETWNFEHPNFRRNQPDQLCLITRKKQAQDKPGDELPASERDSINTGLAAPGLNQSAIVDINSIITGLSAIKRHQAAISSELEDLRAFNQHLWQEAQEARDRHQKQQDTINRILKFLAGVFGNSSTASKGSAHPPTPGVIPRKRQRLMIKGGDTEKERPLEPLDGIDSLVEEEELPHSRFVEVPPVNSPGSTSRASSHPLSGDTSPSSEMLMNGSFPNQSVASPFSAYTPGSTFPTQYPHHDPYDSTSALTSTQTYSPKQDVLQKIASSPGALQRLMTLLQQQQEAPMPPPLDLNTPAPNVPDSMANQPVAQLPLPSNVNVVPQPMNASTMMTNSFGQMNFQSPNAQSLSFLQPDLIPQSTFDAYLENANTLERADSSAADISEDIDTMQSNIESLIQKLGMDPQDFSGVNSFDAQMDGENSFMDNTDDFADVLSGGNNVTNDPISNFDFSAFMNDYTGNGNTNSMDTSDVAINNAVAADDGLDERRSPHLSAYLDEVASQSGKSDTSSAPSITPVNITDDAEDTTPKPSVQAGRRYKKRRSDVENASVERAPPPPKKRR